MGQLIYRKMDAKIYKESLKKRLKEHEDQISYVYVDIAGVPTISKGVALVVAGKDANNKSAWVSMSIATPAQLAT